MQRTNIEYLTHTWNPIAMRCRPISSGCNNCWHLRYADRLAHAPTISPEKKLAYQGLGPIILDEKELEAPMKLKKPARIGVQFMGDLFKDNIDYYHIESILQVCFEMPQHKFLLLTKRSALLRKMSTGISGWLESKNIWTGVSVENQETANVRIRDLAECTDLSHRWLSVEPLLGPIDLNKCKGIGKIDWITCGVETGPSPRPCYSEWIIRLASQCRDMQIPFFFKNYRPDVYPEAFNIQQYPEGLKEEVANA